MFIKILPVILLCILFWVLLAMSRVQIEVYEKTGKKLSNNEFNKAVLKKMFWFFYIKKHHFKKRRIK